MYTNPEYRSNLMKVNKETFDKFKKKLLFKPITQELFKQWRSETESDAAVDQVCNLFFCC